MRTKYQKGLAMLLTLVIVGIMVGLAECLQEKEILFPEITALAVGTLLAPKLSWQTSRTKMLLLIGECSLCGLGLSCLPIGSVAIKMIVGFAFCQVVLSFSKTSFAPMISAMVLPILMETKSWIYPLSAISLTVVIMIGEWLYHYLTKTTRMTYTPIKWQGKDESIAIIKRCVIASILIGICLPLKMKFCVAPPILVAFTEFTRCQCPARKKPIKVVAVIFGCALMGALSRFFLCEYGQLPMTMAALVASMGMIIVLEQTKLYLPPAGALTLLAMLIPREMLVVYPFYVGIGTALLMVSALCFFKDKKQQEKVEKQVA